MRRPIAAAVLAAAAAIATGCLSTPPYKPADGVSYTETGTGGTAAGPGFALHFAGDDATFHFPDALMIDGVDVMGHDPAAGCFKEDEVGVLIAPTPRISAHGGAMPVVNRLVPVLRGPAVVQVKLEWAAPFACNRDSTPGGTATFTVFPDGRIVRHDTVAGPNSGTMGASECSCVVVPGGVNFAVSTFWTLAQARFQKLYAPDEIMLPISAISPIANHATACIDSGAYQVAFAWRDSMGTTIRGGDTLIGFGRDLVVETSMLGDFSKENSAAIFIEHAGCMAAATRARADEHAAPSVLSIGGDAMMPAARDGIYGSDSGDSGDGQPGVLVTDRVELTGTVNSSFAVWLRFPRAVDALRATLENATGPWYMPQRVNDRSWIVWFRAGISGAQKITIEPI